MKLSLRKWPTLSTYFCFIQYAICYIDGRDDFAELLIAFVLPIEIFKNHFVDSQTVL